KRRQRVWPPPIWRPALASLSGMRKKPGGIPNFTTLPAATSPPTKPWNVTLAVTLSYANSAIDGVQAEAGTPGGTAAGGDAATRRSRGWGGNAMNLGRSPRISKRLRRGWNEFPRFGAIFRQSAGQNRRATR